jgi:hypothetical protein
MRVTAHRLFLTLLTLGISSAAEAAHDPLARTTSPPLRVTAGLLQRQVCKLAPLAIESRAAKRTVHFQGGAQLLVVLRAPTKTIAVDRAGQLFVAEKGKALRPVPASTLLSHRFQLLSRLRALSGQAVDLETTRDRIRLVTL